MKKFFILICIAALLTGLRFFDNGLLRIRQPGVYTEYINGTETVYAESERPIFAHKGYARLDVPGGADEAYRGLSALSAKVLWEETVEGILIIYAYSPELSAFETVKGEKVNIMAAVRSGQVAFGTPLLKGSY